MEAFGLRVPLEDLSDGYQSVVALATDLMLSLLARWPSVDVAEGTVLIDELGAHLHPRWRMRIVTSLRQVFPRVQFLSSTHDPLCLRGLGDGEVVVVKRDEAGEIVAAHRPPVRRRAPRRPAPHLGALRHEQHDRPRARRALRRVLPPQGEAAADGRRASAG